MKRVKGKTSQKKQIEFGECVTGMKPDSEGKFKADVRWVDGVYLGMREMTDEYLLGTPKGIIRIHTISRKGTTEEQWNKEEKKAERKNKT